MTQITTQTEKQTKLLAIHLGNNIKITQICSKIITVCNTFLLFI